MTSYTRRRAIRDLAMTAGALSTGAGWSRQALAHSVQPPAPGATKLYVLVQGPWLFSVDPGSSRIRALTTDFSGASGPTNHGYSYVDTRNGSGKKTPIATGENITVTVTRGDGSSAPSSATLLDPIRQNGYSLFYVPGIELIGGLPSNLRQVWLDRPDAIIAAGRLSGIRFTLNNSTSNPSVSAWSTVLAFRYDTWTQATISSTLGSVAETIVPSAAVPVVRRLEIYRNVQPKPVCLAAEEDAHHATSYFYSLMQLLRFPSGITWPIPIFPPCSDSGGAGISINLGEDSTLLCSDMGALSLPCSDSQGQHIPQSNKGGTLVNCASGGGGILNCC